MSAPSLAQVLGVTSVAEVQPLDPPDPTDLAGWTRTIVAGGVEFFAPDGEAMIRVLEPAGAPWAPRGDPAGARRARAGAPLDRRAGTTVLGEVAVLLWMPDDGAGAACARAWVFGDDQTIEVSAIGRAARGAGLRQRALNVIHEVAFAGGATRQRRFLYDPPPGWRAESRGLHADYWPPDGVGGPLTVAAACPRDAVAVRRWDRLMRGAYDAAPDARLDEVVVEDGPFVYGFRLETTPERFAAHRAVLAQVVASRRPIVTGYRAPGASAFAWIDE